jgi:hypothetical protein
MMNHITQNSFEQVCYFLTAQPLREAYTYVTEFN